MAGVNGDPAQVGWLSPTSIKRLRACPLQEAYTASGIGSAPPLGPYQALGVIAHEVSASVQNGVFDNLAPEDVRTAIGTRWDELVEAEYHAMAEAVPGAPPPGRWRRHNLTRARAVRHLEAVVASRVDGRAAEVLAVEEDLIDPGRSIRGTLDRVERRDDGVAVVDLKTGQTGGDAILPGHREQLLVYAHLWQLHSGEWPATIAIEGLDGHEASDSLDPAESEGLIVEVTGLRDDLNARLEAGATPEALGTPSQDVCTSCRYAVRCPCVWAVVDETWDPWEALFAGEVTAVDQAARRFELVVEAGDSGSGTVMMLDVGAPLPEVGELVAVVGAERTNSATTFRWGWGTRVGPYPG